MTCKCGSQLIINFQCKCDDRSCTSYKNYEKDGYVSSGFNIGSGDYVDFDFCATCGSIQKFVPLTEDEIVDKLS